MFTLNYDYYEEGSREDSVGIATRLRGNGRGVGDGFSLWVRDFSLLHNDHTDSEAHSVGQALFPHNQSCRWLELTTHLQVPKLRMRETIPPVSHSSEDVEWFTVFRHTVQLPSSGLKGREWISL
jgi:hypothetical protein